MVVVVFGLKKIHRFIMIIVKLSGGLGNQMFQYAAAKRVATKNNSLLKLDVSWFDQKQTPNTPRPYKLNTYNINSVIALKTDLKKLGIYTGIFHKLFRKFNLYSDKTYKAEKFIGHYPYSPSDKEVLRFKDNIYMEGYWQYEEYFSDIASELAKEFSLKNPLSEHSQGILIKIKNCTNSVSLHVRRGDYTILKQSLTLDYYKRAIKLLIKRVENPEFFIFSDDMAWVKENLKISYPAFFVDDGNDKDFEEMHLMSQCQHHIMANSSFSWWGAWLNSNKKTISLRPKDFFGPEAEEVNFLKNL